MMGNIKKVGETPKRN